jgi:hypothetical protein
MQLGSYEKFSRLQKLSTGYEVRQTDGNIETKSDTSESDGGYENWHGLSPFMAAAASRAGRLNQRRSATTATNDVPMLSSQDFIRAERYERSDGIARLNVA